MATDKTRGVQTRLSVETLDYLQRVAKENGTSLSETIRLIIVERELSDKLSGRIQPFEYRPTTRRNRRSERTAEAVRYAQRIREPDGIAPMKDKTTSAEIREEKRPAAAEKSAAFGEIQKTVFEGTDEEWEQIPESLRKRMTRQ